MADQPASPTLLLVGGARPVPFSLDMALLALRQADARGIRTHITGSQESLAATPTVVAAAGAASPVEFAPPSATAEWAVSLAERGERFDAVYALQEMAQVAVAETAQALGAPGNPPDAVRRVRTKDICRAALAAAGFPQPTLRLCADRADAEAFLRTSRGPWIVKPRDAMGSMGVSQIHDAAGLPDALALLPGPGPFLVEEFVTGPEFSVEGVFQDGAPTVLAVTAKEKTEPPYFVELGHVLPAELPDGQRAEIERQVAAALTVLGLRTGGFHVELWLSPAGIVLGEVHARFGGDWIHRMLAHAIPGLELWGLVFDDMLGRGAASHGSLTPVRGAAVRYLVPPPGRLLAVDGWEDVLAHPDVLYAELTLAVGDEVRPVRKSGDRAGVIVVGAETPALARRLALDLAASVRFTTDAPASAVAPRA